MKNFIFCAVMVASKGDTNLNESQCALFLLLEAFLSFEIMTWATDLDCGSTDWFLFNGKIGLKWVKPVTKTYPFMNHIHVFYSIFEKIRVK